MKKILFVLLLGLTFGCTDLKEEVLDEALNTDLLQGPSAAGGILAPVYARMNNLFNGHEDYFLLQEVSTDEAIVPFRGGTDWYNGGVLIEMHQHTWSSNHTSLANVWNQLTQGIARAGIAESTLKTLNDPNAALYGAEARAMGAFYNYVLFDAFGMCLYRDPASISAGTGESQVFRGQEAIDFLLRELDAVENTLQTKSQVGAGRFTKGAVWALKAKIYLNKAVYLNRTAPMFTFPADDMNKTIEFCDRVVSSNQYALETTDYFRIFNLDNHNHPEHIFVLDQRDDANNGGRFTWFALARNHHFSLINPQSVGTDGGSITPEFWNTWQTNRNDPRFYKEVIPQDGSVTSVPDSRWGLNRGLLQGQQYGIVLNSAGNGFKRTANGELAIEKLFNRARTGEAVDFTVAVDFDRNGGHSNGVRVSKYEVDPRATNGRNFSRMDQPLIRLADIYLMRAEAKLRKGDVSGALEDVNAVRRARKHPKLLTAGELTLDALFNERGYELYWEMVRRTDMIRFGKYEDTRASKTDKDPKRRLFPIPQSAIDANPGLLTQNP
ncbi:RagB/SusD family nutrient uptake outer membrane protein [Fibrisoma montanum]|uniref:RagB/SusD family nutrient uptake outer membrane protein n=1 Tax=Fibrisoma montanum TaxID=2305895 RepID=A0A418MAI6_9BACT|nr:RagB/SusD family nutrient uptake outer membrane protein [Fibrisoma montanum]RIV23385.1 RagB/SusD family nutrient uptake outer membrane protein [Fibrisoma montanum]